MKKPICFLALVAILFACNEDLRFEEAQPAGFPELSQIPSSLHGTYLDDDSVLLIVDEQSVIERHLIAFDEPLDSIAVELMNDQDVIITDSTASGFTAYLKDDDISLHITVNDGKASGRAEYEEVLFSLSDRHVLKTRGKAHYFNTLRKTDQAWVLRRITTKGDSLFIHKVEEPNDRAMLDALTPVKDHYKVDGELSGWQIAPNPDILNLLFDKFGESTKSYKRIKP